MCHLESLDLFTLKARHFLAYFEGSHEFRAKRKKIRACHPMRLLLPSANPNGNPLSLLRPGGSMLRWHVTTRRSIMAEWYFERWKPDAERPHVAERTADFSRVHAECTGL